MIVILTPLLVALVGLLTYALVPAPKLAELGRIAFFCGLLAGLFLAPQFAGCTVSTGKPAHSVP